MADEARTLADVKADADARDTHGLPAPGTPGDPGLQILDATGKGALMRDPKRDPHLAAMLDDPGTFGPAPDYTDDEIRSVVANAIGFEMLKGDGREVRVREDGVEEIDTTDAENEAALRAADRVLGDLDIARHPFGDLRRLQEEQAAWSARNFEPLDPPGHVAALGMGEESGELAEAMAEALVQACSAFALAGAIGKTLHFQLKGEQSIRYTPEEIKAKKADAAGDVLIYLVDFCTRNDIDLADVVRDTWGEVSARDWAANPIDAASIAKAGMPAPKLGDTGVTFEPLMRVRCTQETTYKERYVLPANADPAKCVVPEHVVAGLAHDPLRDASKPCEGIHVLIAEEGDLGTIASVSEDGIIKVVWDGAGDDQPREVLHLDIEPIEHTVEPERPSVIHYPSDGSAQALQASDVGVGLDEALGQGGTFNHLADGSDG